MSLNKLNDGKYFVTDELNNIIDEVKLSDTTDITREFKALSGVQHLIVTKVKDVINITFSYSFSGSNDWVNEIVKIPQKYLPTGDLTPVSTSTYYSSDIDKHVTCFIHKGNMAIMGKSTQQTTLTSMSVTYIVGGG